MGSLMYAISTRDSRHTKVQTKIEVPKNIHCYDYYDPVLLNFIYRKGMDLEMMGFRVRTREGGGSNPCLLLLHQEGMKIFVTELATIFGKHL